MLVTAYFVTGVTIVTDDYINTTSANYTGNIAVGSINSSSWANVSITESQITDLYHNPDTNISDTNASTACAGDQLLDGENNCVNLALGWNVSADTNASTACGANQLLDGNNVCFAFTGWNSGGTSNDTNTDTNASTACTGDQLLDGENNCVNLALGWNVSADTNASTKCAAGQLLDGNNICYAFSGWNSGGTSNDTNTDTNASTKCTGDQVLDGENNCVNLALGWNVSADTNASTACAAAQLLDGNNVCYAFGGWNSGGTSNSTVYADTNASTACGALELLDGNNACFAFSGWNSGGNMNTTGATMSGDLDMSTNNIDNVGVMSIDQVTGPLNVTGELNVSTNNITIDHGSYNIGMVFGGNMTYNNGSCIIIMGPSSTLEVC